MWPTFIGLPRKSSILLLRYLIKSEKRLEKWTWRRSCEVRRDSSGAWLNADRQRPSKVRSNHTLFRSDQTEKWETKTVCVTFHLYKASFIWQLTQNSQKQTNLDSFDGFFLTKPTNIRFVWQCFATFVLILDLVILPLVEKFGSKQSFEMTILCKTKQTLTLKEEGNNHWLELKVLQLK